jgi:hypothetical protein
LELLLILHQFCLFIIAISEIDDCSDSKGESPFLLEIRITLAQYCKYTDNLAAALIED